jgi:biopolymer transport protein ExbD
MAGGPDTGDGDTELHEINVTPFIDVMLVLLIIFMVAAPLSTVDMAVDLPVSTATPQPRPDKPVFLTIKADLSLAVGDDPVPAGQLRPSIDAAAVMDRQKRVFLQADKSVPYGELMRIMNLLRDAGYLKVALVGLEGIDSAGPAGDQAARRTPNTIPSPEPPAAGARSP